jgi:plasmid stabilization system protein ParE
MFGLVFSRKANGDILSALRYMRDTLKAPHAAKSHASELERCFAALRENPYSAPLVRNEQLATKGIRFALVKNYLLFYSINEQDKTVLLYRFLYGRRDWMTLLSNEADLI